MNEHVKVVLYTLLASGTLWLAIDSFLGATEGYASTLDIGSASRLVAGEPAETAPDEAGGQVAERVVPVRDGGRPSDARTDTRPQIESAPTRALDVSLVGCASAVESGGASPSRPRPDPTVGVGFRHGSIAIKGTSLSEIDRLVDAFRDRDSGLLLVDHNPQGRVDIDGDGRLVVRREEELKHYLLQRRVPKARMRFAERS